MTRLTRSDLIGKAQTVRGLIDPEDLGPTLMHEHLLWDIRTPKMQANPDQGPEIDLCNCWHINYGSRGKVPRNLVLFDRKIATQEVAEMRQAGGKTIVELTVGGLKPDPEGLIVISKATDTHIVMGCGHYVDEYQDPANRELNVDDFATEMVGQVYEGAWGSDARAGLIGEIGCQSPWTDLEKRVMEGALIAQKETGCIIELDLFGQEQSFYALNFKVDLPNDADRLRWIRRLIDRGHLDQIAISHDICYKTRLSTFGGHGYGHIFENVIPLMRRRGFSEAEINRIMVETPRRLLTFV